jgi:hypothetical protein
MASSFDQLLAGPISYSAAPRRPVVDIAICLYALSNIALHFGGESCFHELKFNVSLKRSQKILSNSVFAWLRCSARSVKNLWDRTSCEKWP